MGGGAATSPAQGGPLVEGVDHVYIPMANAAEAFAALTRELQLPVMWPFTSFGDFSSGGVSVGSIKLEVIEANTTARWCTAQSPPQVQGVAFRPSATVDDAYLARVDARSIRRSSPDRYSRWTNVYFEDLVGDRAGAFVCDYLVPEPKDLDLRRRVLAECGGGRLTVLDARELVIVASDIRAAEDRWQRLLDPLRPTEPQTWAPALGPSIRLVPGDDDRVDHLSLAVRSVPEAETVWRELSGGPLAGLPLRFVERRG